MPCRIIRNKCATWIDRGQMRVLFYIGGAVWHHADNAILGVLARNIAVLVDVCFSCQTAHDHQGPTVLDSLSIVATVRAIA